MMMWFNGRIAGVSGILFGAISSSTTGSRADQPDTTTGTQTDKLWRILFILGIAIGGAIPALFSNDFLPPPPDASLPLLIIGGLAVGIGTKLGGGCTSGHGICGISRLSLRSITATCTFMAAGFACVFTLKHLFGG